MINVSALGGLHIASLSTGRLAWFSFVCIYRIGIALALLWGGTKYLVHTVSMAELLLNVCMHVFSLARVCVQACVHVIMATYMQS